MKFFTTLVLFFLGVIFGSELQGQIGQNSGPVNVCAPSSITFSASAALPCAAFVAGIAAIARSCAFRSRRSRSRLFERRRF